ncbi:MAG: DUF4395 domain-containing protein [Bacteroidota bacterium]
MPAIIQFGEDIEGYSIPVLNEREIRAASGIHFVFALISLLLIILKKEFILAKYFIVAFLIDFLIRVFINPKYSPTLILGRMIVRNQTPEYVGAPQKQFAWKIGVTLAAIMFVLMPLYNTYSFITGIICFICLIFLFFESAFGICLGCKFYKYFYKTEVQYCPGEVCEVKDHSPIQHVSRTQVWVFIGYILLIVVLVLLLKSTFSVMPERLWNKLGLIK